MKYPQHGFSLVELMVSLAIGSILIAGAVLVYVQSQRTYTVNETTARLQENARYALSILEPDIQQAGYYGLTNLPGTFWFAGSSMVASAQLGTTDAAAPGLALAAHACGNNYPVNLIATVEGSNSAYPLSCAVTEGSYRAATDGLTIRRAAEVPLAAAVAGRLQLLIKRLSAEQLIISDGTLPTGTVLQTGKVELRDLLVRTYFISSASTNRPGVPSLRLKELVAGPAFTETEVMAGVEDLQVQFGIDTGDYDGNGTIDPDQDKDPIDGIPDYPTGLATRYVNPDALPAGFQVVSVRLWLMLRAEQTEQGFVDGRTYRYAGKSVTPNDGFRRVLMMRTIQLRNARVF